jgi:hypothetical protein
LYRAKDQNHTQYKKVKIIKNEESEKVLIVWEVFVYVLFFASQIKLKNLENR